LTTTASDQCVVSDGQNNAGTNLESNARSTDTPEECCSQCAATAGCVGYTWVRDSRECWLKSALGLPHPDQYVISGSMNAPTPTLAPTPHPSPPGPTPPPTPGPACTTPVSCHGALKKQGNRIVDKNGQSVKLDGMSMFWSNWAASFWNADVVKYLASEWNIGIIRCPVGVSNSGGPVGGGYLSDPSGNKARLYTVVDAAIEAGIYVIIDWHVEGRCDAGQSKPFFDEVAAKYGHHENIIFETCNEPTGWGWNQGLKAYHESVIPTIRQHSQNLIVCGTNTWSQDVDEASRDQVSDSNVAYTLHFYSSMHRQPIRDKASTALSNGAAIFVTEWGTEQKREGNFDETNTWLEFLRQHGISNANWGIYDKDSEVWAIVHQGSSPSGHWSDGQITNSGHFVRAYFQGKPQPSPSPGPAPSPGGVKHCASRGGCDCDCSWAASGKCGGDDGSCCYACCCSSFSAGARNQSAVLVSV